MISIRTSALVGSLLTATLMSGCATNAPLTAQQKIRNCAGMVLGGALLGNLIGGDSDGTLKGAAAGGVACGAWLAFNNAADQQRMAEAQQRALQSGQVQQDSWQGEDGRMRSVRVELGDELNAQSATAGIVCRPVMTTISAGSDQAAHAEEWCRLPDGSYQPRSRIA